MSRFFQVVCVFLTFTLLISVGDHKRHDEPSEENPDPTKGSPTDMTDTELTTVLSTIRTPEETNTAASNGGTSPPDDLSGCFMTLMNAPYVIGEASPVGHLICNCRSNAISWELSTEHKITWSSDGTIHFHESTNSMHWIDGTFIFSLNSNNVSINGSLHFSFIITYGQDCSDNSNPRHCLDTRCICTLRMALIACRNMNGTCILVKESISTMHNMYVDKLCSDTSSCKIGIPCGEVAYQRPNSAIHTSNSTTTSQDLSTQQTTDNTSTYISPTTSQDLSTQQTTDNTSTYISPTTSQDLSTQHTTDNTSTSISPTTSQDLSTQKTTDSTRTSISTTSSQVLSTQQTTDSTRTSISPTTSQDPISDLTTYSTTSSTLTTSTIDQIENESRRDTTTVHGGHVYQDKCFERYEEGVFFPETDVGQTVTTQCPQNYDGTIGRDCLRKNTWGSFHFTQCLRKSITEIIKRMIDPSLQTDAEDVANDIKNSVLENITLLSGDLKSLVSVIASLSQMKVSRTAFEDLMNTSHIILSAKDSSWNDLQDDKTKFFLQMLKNVDDITQKFIIRKELKSFSKSLPYFSTRIMSIEASSLSAMARTEDIQIELSLEESKSSEDLLAITVFGNLNSLKSHLNVSLGSKIIAIAATVHVKTVKIFLTYEQINGNTPACHFIESNPRNLTWTTRGCATQILNSSELVCMCNHASIFAIIMSPFTAPKGDDLLKNLTMGCLIGSIFCLCLAIGIYTILIKKLKKEKVVTHLSLCSSLVIGYLLFVTGINLTDNEIVCRVIAVFLHLAFLISQFAMLANGIELSNIIFVSTSRKPIWKYLLVVVVVPPIIIVVATLAATKAEGHGTNDYCWLSPDNGTTWAFIGPVLSIWLINAIILLFTLRALCGLEAVRRLNKLGQIKMGLWAVCVLSPIMGTSYLIGLGAFFKDVPEAHFIFIGLNGGQGLLILIFDCLCQKDIRSGLYDVYKRIKSRQLHRTKTQTGIMQTSSPVLMTITTRNPTEETKL